MHGEEGFRVTDGRSDFQAVADDTSVGQENGDVRGVVAGDFGGVEMIERAAVVFAFGEDGGPAEAGLGTFEGDEFEEGAVVVVRDAPLGVVIGDVERFGGPGAAGCRHERRRMVIGREGEREGRGDAAEASDFGREGEQRVGGQRGQRPGADPSKT